MAAAFFFRQNIAFAREVRMRRYRSRRCQNLSALYFFSLRAAQQNTDVIAGFPFVQKLAEHFNAGARCFLRRTNTDDFNFVADMQYAALYTTGYYRTPAGNREYVFNRHQERFVFRTIRLRNVAVYCLHQFNNRIMADLRISVLQYSQS